MWNKPMTRRDWGQVIGIFAFVSVCWIVREKLKVQGISEWFSLVPALIVQAAIMWAFGTFSKLKNPN